MAAVRSRTAAFNALNTRRAAISIRMDGDCLVIADTGIGIAAEDLPRIYSTRALPATTAGRTASPRGLGCISAGGSGAAFAHARDHVGAGRGDDGAHRARHGGPAGRVAAERAGRGTGARRGGTELFRAGRNGGALCRRGGAAAGRGGAPTLPECKNGRGKCKPKLWQRIFPACYTGHDENRRSYLWRYWK